MDNKEELQQALITLVKALDLQGQETVALLNAIAPDLTDAGLDLSRLLVQRLSYIFDGVGAVAQALDVPHQTLVEALEDERPQIH